MATLHAATRPPAATGFPFRNGSLRQPTTQLRNPRTEASSPPSFLQRVWEWGTGCHLVFIEQKRRRPFFFSRRAKGPRFFFPSFRSVSQDSYGNNLNVSKLLRFAGAYRKPVRSASRETAAEQSTSRVCWGDAGVGKQSQK